MTNAEWAHVVGTLLTFLGGIGLGYDLLTGYPNRNRAEIVRVRLDNLKQFKVRMEADYKSMIATLSASEIQALIHQLNTKFPNTELEAEYASLTGGREEKAYLLGWAGFWALAIGFGLEFLLALAPFFKTA